MAQSIVAGRWMKREDVNREFVLHILFNLRWLVLASMCRSLALCRKANVRLDAK